jgi:hypothetical protein
VIGAFDYPIEGIRVDRIDRDGRAVVVTPALKSAANPTIDALGEDAVRIELVRDEPFSVGIISPKLRTLVAMAIFFNV